MKSLILQVFDHIPNINLGCVRFNYVQTRNDGYDVDMHLVFLRIKGKILAPLSKSLQVTKLVHFDYLVVFFSDFECFIVDCMISYQSELCTIGQACK